MNPFSVILLVYVLQASGEPKEYRDVYRTMAECEAILQSEVDKRGEHARGQCFDLNLRYDQNKRYWTGPTYMYTRPHSSSLR